MHDEGFWHACPTFGAHTMDIQPARSLPGRVADNKASGVHAEFEIRVPNKPREERSMARIVKRRQPYGRHWLARRLITEPGIRRQPASSFVGQAKYVTKSYPMPHGGVRWSARCPQCGRRVCHLYSYVNMEPPQWRCRRCRYLGYWSQYQGRASEADVDRIFMLIERARLARSPAVRERRVLRAVDAFAVWARRERRFQERVEERKQARIARRMAKPWPKRFRIRL
jgi:hypothetical protein